MAPSTKGIKGLIVHIDCGSFIMRRPSGYLEIYSGFIYETDFWGGLDRCIPENLLRPAPKPLTKEEIAHLIGKVPVDGRVEA